MSRKLNRVSAALIAVGLSSCAPSAIFLQDAEKVLTVAGEVSTIAGLLGAGPAATAATVAIDSLQKVVASAEPTLTAATTEPAPTRAQAFHLVVLAYQALPQPLRDSITTVTAAGLQALDAKAQAATATEADVDALGDALVALEPLLHAQVAATQVATPVPTPPEVLP